MYYLCIKIMAQWCKGNMLVSKTEATGSSPDGSQKKVK